MIKLTSFYPFAGFLRVTQEFYDDKFIVKTKSLTFEQEAEFSYSKVAEISDSYQSSSSQMLFGWYLIGLTSIAFIFLCNIIYATPVLLRITQILYICGILLFITGFIKSWHTIFSDKDHYILTSVKQTSRKLDAISQVTELITRKSENIREISASNPFPETTSKFEHIYYDIPKVQKTTDRFYEDEIIGFEKSLFTEKAYIVKYRELSGKLYKAKMSNNIWGTFFAITIIISAVMIGLYRGFNILPRTAFLYTAYASLFIWATSWPLNFVKRDAVGFYAKSGKVKYWAYVNRADKEKFEKIIEFVQSKIPAENKEASLKE